MTTKTDFDIEFLTSKDVRQMHSALLLIDAKTQEIKDLVNKFGHGGMFLQEELDAHMKHTAQLLRLHRTAQMRISALSSKVRDCIHCHRPLANYHGRFARCSGGETQFEAARIRHDDWKNA